MRVVLRSRLQTKVRVKTIGMYVPRSPTAPLSSEDREFLMRREVVHGWMVKRLRHH